MLLAYAHELFSQFDLFSQVVVILSNLFIWLLAYMAKLRAFKFGYELSYFFFKYTMCFDKHIIFCVVYIFVGVVIVIICVQSTCLQV